MIKLFLSGEPVMYPLLLCSVITLTVIIERSIFWMILNKNYQQKLVDDILKLYMLGNWKEVRLRTAGTGNYLIRILVSGILHREYSMIKAMESTASDEVNKMRLL